MSTTSNTYQENEKFFLKGCRENPKSPIKKMLYSYTFGFNGQEKDNEIKGAGNSINYKARIYDARLGRFMSVDPLIKSYPMLTPYQFASNTPIRATDLDGMEADFTYFYRQIWGALGITTKTETEIKANLKEASESKAAQVTTGVGNVIFGAVGAAGSLAYTVETGGIGAAAGGSVALGLSFSEIGLGCAQIADVCTGGKNHNLQESGSLIGYGMREKGIEGADAADAVIQFLPGMLSGGNLKSIYTGWSKIKASKNATEGIFNSLALIDAFADTKGLVDESKRIFEKYKSDIQNPENSKQSIRKDSSKRNSSDSSDKKLGKREVSDIKKFVEGLK